MKLGLFQVTQESGLSVEKRIDLLLYLMEECLKNGAQIVFMPEAWQYVDVRGSKEQCIRLYHEYAPGTFERCAALAKKYHAYVAPWEYDLDEQGNLYNAMYLIGKDGVRIGTHRKTHLTYGESMRTGLSHGDAYHVFDLDIGKISFLICFENYFPEPARIMGEMGAQLLLFSLAGDNKMPYEQWEIKLRARAIDSCVYVASEQRALYRPMQRSTAFTGLVGPSGEILCRLNTEKETTVIDIDLGAPKLDYLAGGVQADMRAYLDISRRPLSYGALCAQRQKMRWEDTNREALSITGSAYEGGG